MGAVALIGAAAIAGGTYLKARGAGQRKKALKKLAKTPGLDFSRIEGDYLNEAETFLPQQTRIAEKITSSQQNMLTKLLRETIPGYDQLVQGRSDALNSYIRGELPKDVAAKIDRAAAGRNIDRFGTFGGTFGDRQKLAADVVGSTALSQWGIGQLPQVLQSTPRVNPYDVSKLFGPDPTLRTQVRANERSQAMGLQGQAIQVPSGGEIAGEALGQVGGLALGYGLGGLMGGGASGATPATNVGQTSIANPSMYGSQAWQPSTVYTPPSIAATPPAQYGMGGDWYGDYSKQWRF